jgi:DNA-binding NarL/FixJ family response regulator
MDPLRLLIADDHPLFRHGLAGALESEADIEVVGEATTGDEAISFAACLQPDVVLMDIQMPGSNGIEATRAIVGSSPQIRVLILTMFEDDASVFMAMRAGAHGYVLKDSEKEAIVRAIHAVGRGEAIFSPAIASRVIEFFAARQVAPRETFPTLTEREREVLQLLAEGQSNAVIVKTLALSPKTVSNYLSNIFSKLQVADRAEAVLRARRAGLGPGDGTG